MPRALLALFTRAMREDVRAKSMYWARAALVGMVLCLIGLTNASMGWAGAPGLEFFRKVIWLNLLFISLAGLSYFSSAITEEKEEMTLGLLRMTNLNPLSILLGKSASRQVGALLLLLSQVPFTLLAVALGGVTFAQIIAAYFCLGAYTLFLGNVALFHSVISRRTTYAALLTFVLMVVFFFGPWIIRSLVFVVANFFHWIPSAKPGATFAAFLNYWEQTSPITRLLQIGVTGFHDGPIGFQVISNLVVGLGFFLGAWAVFDIFCNEQHDVAPPRGLLRTRTKRIKLFSPGRAWSHALVWKDFHFLGGGHALVLSRIIVYTCLIGAILFIQGEFPKALELRRATLGYILIWTMLVALIVRGAFVAARVFQQERIWKTWSSLAMLPLSIHRIACQKIVGCILADWPALLIFAVGFALSVDDWFPDLFTNRNRFPGNLNKAFIFFSSMGHIILFYHLVADLSLRLKWGAGALPLAFGIMCVGALFEEGMFQGAATVIVLTCLLHIDIGRRLEQIASED